jgi:hypothetical protein
MRRHLIPPREVIAERRLTPRGASRPSVVVSLGTPRTTDGSDHWECPFSIVGAGMRRAERGVGVDAFQALTLALEGIRRVLDRLDTPLVWDGVIDDHSGFQRAIPWSPERRRGHRLSIRKGTNRLERMVDREVRRWVYDMKRRYLDAKRRKTAAAPDRLTSRAAAGKVRR